MNLYKCNRFVVRLVLALQVFCLAGGQPASAQRKSGRRVSPRAGVRPGNAANAEGDKQSSRYVAEGLRYAGEGKRANPQRRRSAPPPK